MRLKSILSQLEGTLKAACRIFIIAALLNTLALQSQAADEGGISITAKSNSSTIVPVMITIPGKNYELGQHEVTQNEWEMVMCSNPSNFRECGGNCPVENVSWDDAQIFIEKLNTKTGKQYRLPTESEWEFACHGGIQTKYCGGSEPGAVAWYDENSRQSIQPVGQKQANGYGLFDMSGNVWEWTSDCYSKDCSMRVVKGGSWSFGADFAQASYRSIGVPSNRNNNFGFRLARTLP